MKKKLLSAAALIIVSFAAQAGWVKTTCGKIVEIDATKYDNFQAFEKALFETNAFHCGDWAYPDYSAYPYPEPEPTPDPGYLSTPGEKDKYQF